MPLFDFGWNSHWESAFNQLPPAADWRAARILRQDRGVYTLATEDAVAPAALSGRFLHRQHASSPKRPAVGDWVACDFPESSDQARIHQILPRRTQFARKEAGRRSLAQVVAANVDTVFLVSGLDQNFKLRRIERYLTVARQSGAEPVIVLNKADLCADLGATLSAVEAIALGTPIVALSALNAEGLEELQMFVRPYQTAALLGSSGVGKSTLLNALLGEARQTVQANREDDSRGRHTTTARELFVLPNRALLIDTPGMRELGLTSDESPSEGGFTELDELAAQCRFSDCRHESEPGCAIQSALSHGTIDPAHLENWQRLQREQAFAARQQDARLQRAETARWKRISQQSRQLDQFRKKQRDA